jgi:urea transport system permease protein
MDLAISTSFEIVFAVASLMMISIGLAVIFGMMRVINFAHGEFLMLGGYATVLSVNHGVNIWIAIFVISPLLVGVVGALTERLLIRHLYGRLTDTLLATWALSLLIIGLVSTLLGTTTQGISTPLGSFSIGLYSISVYYLLMVAVTVAVLAGLWLVLRWTRWGLLARGTMQNAAMAGALGIDCSKIHFLTFAAGSALTGLAGGLLAPITGVVPTMGVAYVAKAFIAVICGGPAILAGLITSSTAFGTINQLVVFQTTPVVGETALLLSAIILLRLMPQGITGRIFRRSL